MTPQHARSLSGEQLAAALQHSRALLHARVDDLSEAQWAVPQQPGANLVAWELAHLAWFGEFWVLRGPHHVSADGFVHAQQPARWAGPDALFDSARLAHAERWAAALPSRAALGARLQAQLEACIAALPDGDDDAALYFHRLALFHELMHAEAFAWLRATLAYPAPAGLALARFEARDPIVVRGGPVRIGWPDDRPGFAFDNERGGRQLVLHDFEIDAVPVTTGQFLPFVQAGGYSEPAYWPAAAGAWRAACGAHHPARWRERQGDWQVRWFDRWLPLDPAQPVVHVNAWEAEAWCRWAGRRLPSAAEWEHAAVSTPMRWGHSVWEWTADPFVAYPGFVPGPYKDYSAPWFGNHRELRGGAFATDALLHDACYRNFFMPERNDVFAGFRSVTL
jgi:gamma-glutamyl hercynylcysteine S-oxide synthase